VSFHVDETSSLAVHKEKTDGLHSGVSLTSIRGWLFLLLSVSTPLFLRRVVEWMLVGQWWMASFCCWMMCLGLCPPGGTDRSTPGWTFKSVIVCDLWTLATDTKKLWRQPSSPNVCPVRDCPCVVQVTFLSPSSVDGMTNPTIATQTCYPGKKSCTCSLDVVRAFHLLTYIAFLLCHLKKGKYIPWTGNHVFWGNMKTVQFSCSL